MARRPQIPVRRAPARSAPRALLGPVPAAASPGAAPAAPLPASPGAGAPAPNAPDPLVAQAVRRIGEEGAFAAVAFVRALAGGPTGLPPPRVREVLMRTASAVQQRNPGAALVIVEAVLEEDPEATGARAMLGTLLDRTGRQPQAREAVERVVRTPGAPPEHILQAANLLVRLGGGQLAMDAARSAFDALGRPLRLASGLLYIAQRVADWPMVDALVRQLAEAHAAGRTEEARESPRTHLLWCDDEAVNIRVVSGWTARSLPDVEGARPPMPAPLDGRRIRVGYLSSDYREHPTSRLINGLLRNHDHARFEVFLYCSGWDDGSEMRREIESHCEHVHSVTRLSDRDAAALIRSHGIDVLVELNGPTRANRLGILAHRPAPVRIDYLGWPGSIGGRLADYVVGDLHTVPPGAEALYPEKVIRLSEVYQINDYAARTLPPAPTRASLGLPVDRPVLGMFNAINKVGGGVWEVWMRILRAVPEAVLWLLDPGPAARANVLRTTAALGVDPGRILIAPTLRQADHLPRLQCCDLMLDPWPYGGHTSTSDALFAGVPVIALDGGNFAGRVSGALLRAARLGAFAQPDVDRYVKVAVSLLRRPEELERARRFIRERIAATDVFDARSKTRQMELAYRAALQRAIDGLPPAHLTLRRPDAGSGPHAAAPAPAA